MAAETLRVRQAALLLHGLPREARQRVLARLSDRETARLQPLLKELTELGVAQSLGYQLHELMPEGPPTAGASKVGGVERAASLSAVEVERSLQSCAAVTAAAVLRASEWPWKQGVLDRMSDLRRAEVMRHLRGAGPLLSPAVLAALCARLCDGNGAERADVVPPVSRPSVVSRLRRIMKWTR